MPRLNHRKARTGCQRCKARKVKVRLCREYRPLWRLGASSPITTSWSVIGLVQWPLAQDHQSPIAYFQYKRAMIADCRQCDEERPRCSACTRHNISCEYSTEARRNQLAPPTPSTDVSNPPTSERRDTGDDIDPSLELRLMHEWTAYTCKTLATDVEFWTYQVPLIALQFRPVLDSVLAMAALHASRQPPKQWVPTEGRSKFSLRYVNLSTAHLFSGTSTRCRIRPSASISGCQ